MLKKAINESLVKWISGIEKIPLKLHFQIHMFFLVPAEGNHYLFILLLILC